MVLGFWFSAGTAVVLGFRWFSTPSLDHNPVGQHTPELDHDVEHLGGQGGLETMDHYDVEHLENEGSEAGGGGARCRYHPLLTAVRVCVTWYCPLARSTVRVSPSPAAPWGVPV